MEADELRSQLARLESVVSRLARSKNIRSPETLSQSTPQPPVIPLPSNRPTIDSLLDLSETDLAGTMTQLFMDQIDGYNKTNGGTDSLLKSAGQALGLTENNSFNIPPSLNPQVNSIDDLIDFHLPNREDVDKLINIYAKGPHRFNFCIPPTFRHRLKEFYDSDWKPLPSLHYTAQLFAILAVSLKTSYGVLFDTIPVGVEREVYVGRLLGCAFKALQLSEYTVNPTLEAVRTLSILTTMEFNVSL